MADAAVKAAANHAKSCEQDNCEGLDPRVYKATLESGEALSGGRRILFMVNRRYDR